MLAGAGTGKTRVITHRIGALVDEGVDPRAILAVTFTNKAAKEMRARLSQMGVSDDVWIGTFHATGARLLRMYPELVGYTKNFTIYDGDDQKALVRAFLADVDTRGKKVAEGLVLHLLQQLKGRGLGPKDVERDDSGVPGDLHRIVREVYSRYEEALLRSNAMDFADLLLNTAKLLRNAKGTRAEHMLTKFQHVLVDEFQDTNSIQMEMADLFATKGELCVVGDDDQCLVRGTMVTMEDGSLRPIEKIERGDRVRSCYGSGDFRGALVTDVFCKLHTGRLVKITMAGGRVLTSTPEHTHFGGYRLGKSPQTYVTYLMQRCSVGWRLGTTRVSAGTSEKAILGFAQRLNQERGDSLWVVSTHASENESRLDEYVTSLKYQIPTLPFVPRTGQSVNGLVHDQQYLDAVFSKIDSETGALRLLSDRGFSRERPHHRPRSRNANRRNVTVTLCGDHRGNVPMHRISIAGNDDEGRERLEALGFSVRAAGKNSANWRVESSFKDFGDLRAELDRMREAFDLVPIFNARFGKPDDESRKASLPFVAADSVMPGMVMFLEDASYDVVENIETLVGIEQVYDLNVEHTHNFVANGIVTHNSIYGWRGANPDGMMDFADRPGVVLVKLEENYRCTTPILDCANAVIAHNSKRLGKTLRPNKDGELVRVSLLANDRAEALQVASTISEPWSDHAVLYRTHAQSRPIEEALRGKGIPYTIVGGLRFYDRSEVKDVLAFFKLAVNPKGDVDLLRVANKPARGMGPKKMGSLKTFAAKRKICTFDALKESDDEKAGELRELLLQLAEAKHSAMSLLDFFDSVMRLTGYREALKKTAAASKSIVQREKAQQKIENVNELANDLSTYQQEHVGATVDSYLEHVALVSSFDKESGPAVCLMTIHAAKGLEYPHIHLVGFEENLLPHVNSVRAAERYGKEGEIEEERRLTYVAITRAKDKLDITLTRIRSRQGRPERAEPSRFLAELPDGRFKKIGF